MKNIDKEILCRMIDHTCLKPFADEAEFAVLCKEARENHFAMVAINPAPVSFCKELLKDTEVHVGAAISFPLGQATLETKVFETSNAINNGADEIDYVINVARVKEHDYAYIKKEMESITKVCRAWNVICKVIFENCYLSKEEIVAVAEIARIVRPDFIKTSTGFGSGGAEAQDVKLMKETVGDLVKVKAAGGIRSLSDCLKMIEAGAERIGTSCGIDIIGEFNH